ncbi:DUF5810 domain-containing protein [Halopiger xanaduensis]|uniref:Uncharacterized protein n=1 Tax=Halopiger xanaduensis (strain DSM 18323 / JCM 14033 / SH-6) TaxID=797210 RepID=F8DAD7_HALXS|nr:DUF5810 domain-containing protein [Halopiger xanaduensis]AEH38008.1 hypothetical protein Halxa_3396 [Halopiger xanaduensis SH-6]
MGYACPVCDAEEADAKHLANHLAITASLGRQEHEDWLEEHAPDWPERSPEELGEIVSRHAPEIETPEFEGGPQGHDHDHGHGHGQQPGRPALENELARQSRQPGRGSLTAEAEGVLEEARELTRQMRESDGGAGESASEAADADGEGGDSAAEDAADETGNENA